MLDVLFFYLTNIYLTDWVIVFGLLALFLFVFSLVTEDLVVGAGVVVGIIIITIVGYCGAAILSPEISEEDYKEVFLLKKQAQDGKYIPESNEALLHVIKLSSADNKINEFDYFIIKKTEKMAIKKTYVSNISHD